MIPLCVAIRWIEIMKKTHLFDPRNTAILEMEDRKTWQDPENILAVTEIKSHFVAVDLGCGSGFFTIPLSQKVKKVYGIDVQKEMLELLEEKIRKLRIKNIELRLSREAEIPLEKESVDLLLSINALHEFTDKQRMVGEMQRVLKQVGAALIVDFKKKNTGFGPPVSIRVSKKKAIDLFEEAGFVTSRNQELPYHYLLVFSKKKS
jgi:ubiquinone/menaquinone biosynthesis C-methylase UbiE